MTKLIAFGLVSLETKGSASHGISKDDPSAPQAGLCVYPNNASVPVYDPLRASQECELSNNGSGFGIFAS